jgi:flavorubredoxin
MHTTTAEISDGIFRFSTYVPDAGISFNQFLVTGDEPLLFHAGMRAMFPLVSEAVGAVLPIEQLRWISFGHIEADESGAANEWLAAAPSAEIAFGALGCMTQLNDLADRPPRPLDDGEVLDIGGKRLRYLATPHVPHGWEAGLFFEETTGTLLCGDLFTSLGDGPAVSHDSPMELTAAAEDALGYSTLAPNTVPTMRRLGELEPTTLALMHGSAHVGDGAGWLGELAGFYEARVASISNAI